MLLLFSVSKLCAYSFVQNASPYNQNVNLQRRVLETEIQLFAKCMFYEEIYENQKKLPVSCRQLLRSDKAGQG